VDAVPRVRWVHLAAGSGGKRPRSRDPGPGTDPRLLRAPGFRPLNMETPGKEKAGVKSVVGH